MTTRTIRSLWITRKSIDSGFHPPELVEAWDHWSIDENPHGWQDACREALDAVGSDLAFHRYIDIRVADSKLNEAFEPVQVGGILTSITGGAMAELGKPQASWTDNLVWGQRVGDLTVDQLQQAARKARVDPDQPLPDLAADLAVAEQPTGWKWEG